MSELKWFCPDTRMIQGMSDLLPLHCPVCGKGYWNNSVVTLVGREDYEIEYRLVRACQNDHRWEICMRTEVDDPEET